MSLATGLFGTGILLKARLIYDGTGEPAVPPELGKPAPGQLEGTPRERVAEIAGRTCYDSLGKGRSSADYHRHLHAVRHYSVHAHTPLTVRLYRFNKGIEPLALALSNRPGVSFRTIKDDEYGVRVTFNYAAVCQWEQWTADWIRQTEELEAISESVGRCLTAIAYHFAPMLVASEPADKVGKDVAIEVGSVGAFPVDPRYAEEKWVSLFLAMGRTGSHEQVRHHYECGISQRSTRYVDETESPIVPHPLLLAWLRDPEGDQAKRKDIADCWGSAMKSSRFVYAATVSELEKYAKKLMPGLDNTSARKQARGAARGILPMGLYTEMVFSASVRQWRFMLSQRGADPADAEIRQLYTGPGQDTTGKNVPANKAGDYDSVLAALRTSAHADDFADLVLAKSTDGLGWVAQPK